MADRRVSVICGPARPSGPDLCTAGGARERYTQPIGVAAILLHTLCG